MLFFFKFCVRFLSGDFYIRIGALQIDAVNFYIRIGALQIDAVNFYIRIGALQIDAVNFYIRNKEMAVYVLGNTVSRGLVFSGV